MTDPAPSQALAALLQQWREQAQVHRVALSHTDQVRDGIYAERLRTTIWMFDHCADELAPLVEAVQRLEAERDALRAALQQYGQHRRDCAGLFPSEDDAMLPCSCGFARLLAATQESPE